MGEVFHRQRFILRYTESLLISPADDIRRFSVPKCCGFRSLRSSQAFNMSLRTDMASIRKRYGHRNLKALVVASELFDTLEEKTPGGGLRTLFRIKRAAPH
jgi:hypothetical protein